MLPRNRNICDANLALMPATQLNLFADASSNHVQSLIPLGLSLQALQHDVRGGGPFNHEKFEPLLFLLYDLWVGVFADLALKLRKVVADGDGVLLHHHLRFNPFLQAIQMDYRATSLAGTR